MRLLLGTLLATALGWTPGARALDEEYRASSYVFGTLVEVTALDDDPGHARFERLEHRRRDEAPDVAAEAEDFFDQARGDEGVLDGGEHEDGLDFGAELAVHERHLQFVFVVGDGADAADDDFGVQAAHEVDEEAVEGVHFDAGDAVRAAEDELHPLRDGEQRRLPFVLQHRHHDHVEQLRRPADDVEVSVRHRVERAGVNGNAHERDGNRRVGSWQSAVGRSSTANCKLPTANFTWSTA